MKKIFLSIGAFFAPAIAFAQANPNHLFSIIDSLKNLLNKLIPILIIAAVLYFIWGVIQFVITKDEEERAKSKDKMIYGLIGLFVILSVYGIVYFIGNTLGIGQGGSAAIPCVTGTYVPGLGCQ